MLDNRIYVYYRFFSGGSLRDVTAEAANYAEVLGQVKQDAYFRYIRLYQQGMLCLGGDSAEPLRLQGKAFDEEAQLISFEESVDGHGIANLMLMRMILHTLLGKPADVLAAARLARPHIQTIAGMIQLPVFHFYHALAAAAIERGDAGERSLDQEERKFLRDDMRKLEKWTSFAPQNMEHKWLMARAERLRAAGRTDAAAADYDRAVELAGQHGYVQEQALANELAARFYEAGGREKLARTYMADAYQGYLRWGAVAKLRSLEAEFPRLTVRMAQLMTKPDTTRGSRHSSASSTVPDDTTEATEADVTGLLDRLQGLRSELKWSSLLARVLNLSLEQSGAKRALLILQRKEHLVVEAEVLVGGDSTDLGARSLLQDREDVAQAVIRHTCKQGRRVVLRDASIEGPFMRDAYVFAEHPRSIFCIPLALEDRVLGALYLENGDEAGVFTGARVPLMQIMADEITLALDNAIKYQVLAEEKRDLELQLKAFTEEQGTVVEEKDKDD